MKKLLTILISSLTRVCIRKPSRPFGVVACATLKRASLVFLILHSSFAAEDFDETLLTQIDEYSRYCGLRLQQMEFSAPLLRSRLADCNTFIWYLWNDADAAKGNIEKFNVIESINTLTQPKGKN